MKATLENDFFIFTYGTDKIEGWFVSVQYKTAPEKSFMNSSARTRGFNLDKIVKLAEKYDFDISYELEAIPEEEPFDLSGSGCGGGCEECVRRGV